MEEAFLPEQRRASRGEATPELGGSAVGSNGVDFLSTDGDGDPDESSVCVQVVVRHLQGSSAVAQNQRR